MLGGGLTDPIAGHDPIAGGDPCSRRQHAITDLCPQVFQYPEIDRVGTGTHPVIVADTSRGRAPMTNLYRLRPDQAG